MDIVPSPYVPSPWLRPGELVVLSECWDIPMLPVGESSIFWGGEEEPLAEAASWVEGMEWIPWAWQVPLFVPVLSR